MANISPQLLAVLRCPATGSPLAQTGSELVSTAAGTDGEPCRYSILEGIPVLLRPTRAATSETQE